MLHSLHQDVFHAPCQMLLPTCQFTLDALISAAALDQNKLRARREAERANERESSAWRTKRRERVQAERERERASLTTALASACGDIVLKFCASNKVISMKLSLFIIALCDCVHREYTYPTLYGGLIEVSMVDYTRSWATRLFIASFKRRGALRFAHLQSRYRAEISQFQESRPGRDGASLFAWVWGLNAPSTYTENNKKLNSGQLLRDHKIKLPINSESKENPIGVYKFQKIEYPNFCNIDWPKFKIRDSI